MFAFALNIDSSFYLIVYFIEFKQSTKWSTLRASRDRTSLPKGVHIVTYRKKHTKTRIINPFDCPKPDMSSQIQ